MKILAVFDFDQTLLEHNTDVAIQVSSRNYLLNKIKVLETPCNIYIKDDWIWY